MKLFHAILAMMLIPVLLLGFAILFIIELIRSTDWKSLWKGER